MTLLENVTEVIYNHNIESLKKRHLYLAYLQFHMENDGLHPDDYLVDGGYPGWAVLLVDKVLTESDNLPDEFQYPVSFSHLKGLLEELSDELEADVKVDEASYTQLSGNLQTIKEFCEEFKPSTLHAAVEALTQLVLHYTDENKTAEEEEAEELPVYRLRTCCDVLTWIQQFK